MNGLGLRWGTWEELVLGGAVLRHGTDSWDAVAGELRARTASPNLFTPQECQAKYEDIQEQYSGCDAWFEELRKRRVAELKRELERSEDSIGSLQSKLESLTSERETGSNFGYNTSQSESTSPIEDADGVDSSSKEASRDGSSVGSFTEKTGRDWTGKCQNLASVSLQEDAIKVQKSEDPVKAKLGCGCLGLGFEIFKKKRGKRKRKGCNIVKEGSVEDSDMASSVAFTNREGSAEGCNQDTNLPPEDNDGTWMCEDDAHLDLAGIMDSIMEHKDVSVFRSRLESQKRARYKKMIRRHVDLRNISSKIGDGSISSAKELFRDLLLLCSNALVFYQKNSSEHKAALILRELVTRMLRRSFSSRHPTCSYSDDEDEGAIPESVGKPKKLRTALQQTTIKNALVAREGDGTPFKENVVVAGKADETLVKDNALLGSKGGGTSFKNNATYAGKADGTLVKDSALVGGKGGGTSLKKNATVAGKADGTLVKNNALVGSKGVGTSLKKNAMVGGKADGTSVKENVAVTAKVIAGEGAGTLKENAAVTGKGVGIALKENGALAGKRDGTPLKERGNKGSRANMAEESLSRKRGIGRPVKGGQRGSKKCQEIPSKGRKRARR